MNRRDFVKNIAALSLASWLTVTLPTIPQAQAAGKMFRGSAEGRIFESTNGGLSWRPVANFGPTCPIVNVFQNGPHLYAQVGCQNHTFFITSPDARSWRVLKDQTPVNSNSN
ncbi:MAG TPA: hypothetical protein VEC93_16345 [Anaerolineae bacterium]|nr:hypothetical protein [Anaerolineae bacterium]